MKRKKLLILFSCFVLFFISLLISGCQTGPQQIQTNPPMVNFYAVPAEVSPGEDVTLYWNVQNADQATINQGIGEITDLEGNMIVNPTQTTKYTLTATNESDSSIVTITVTVNENTSNEGKGTLVVNANVPATIYFDGISTGYAAPHSFNDMEPGTYVLKLTLTYWMDWEQEVTVQAGETTIINAELEDGIRTAVLQPGISEGKDAWILNSDRNFNSEQLTQNRQMIKIGGFYTQPYGNCICKSYFYFDLESIPATANIMESKLHLFYFDTNNGECSYNCDFYVFEILDSWNENSICWNNKPAEGDFGWGNTDLPDAPNNEFVEITINPNLVERWVQGDNENYGFLVSFGPGMEEYCQLTRIFHSSEYNVKAQRPKLVVKYWSPE